MNDLLYNAEGYKDETAYKAILQAERGRAMQKYLLFLLGFSVKLKDRRTGDTEEGFIIIPFPEEHPEDLEDAHAAIESHYSRLGYDASDITYQESKVKEIDLAAEYDAAQTTAAYAE